MKKNNLESVGVVNKYFFDKRIFRSAVIILFILLFAAFIDNGWDFENSVYVHCPTSEPLCANPYYEYEPCPYDYLCDQEYLFSGDTYGEAPNSWFNIYLTTTLVLIIFSFLLNHLIHNMRKTKK